MGKGQRNRTFRKVKYGLAKTGIRAGRRSKQEFARSWSQDPKFRKWAQELIVLDNNDNDILFEE